MSATTGKLERRARFLLRAYPAEYRHGRAEEIIGTLLEAAPPGQSYPAARVGGGASRLTSAEVAAGAAAALAPWLGSRAATTALAVLAATFNVVVSYRELSTAHYYSPEMYRTIAVTTLAGLVVFAALAALSGGPARLPRSWLWLPCAFPLALVAGRLLHYLLHLSRATLNQDSLVLGALVLLAVVVACWLATDPRPAFSLCLAFLLYMVMVTLPDLVYGDTYGVLIRSAVISAVVLPVMIPATWLLLRRQKAPGSRPHSGP